jgi:hypothetical protein
MRSHPALAVALLCAASMTVAACGSSVAAGPQSPKIDPAFVAKVNAFCAAEARRVPTYGKQFPYPISIQTTPTWRLSPKSAATSQPGCRNGISSPPALPPSASQRQAARSGTGSRGLALQENAVGIRQVNVALASQAQAFTETAHAITKIADELHNAARSAGFSTTSPCGQLF